MSAHVATDSPGLEAAIKQILTTRLGMPVESITLEARLVDDLGMDSLDAVELAIAAERQFHVSISDEQVAKLVTVRDIMTLVQRLREESGSGA